MLPPFRFLYLFKDNINNAFLIQRLDNPAQRCYHEDNAKKGRPPAVVLAESAVTVKAAQETRAPATTPERRAETRRDGRHRYRPNRSCADEDAGCPHRTRVEPRGFSAPSLDGSAQRCPGTGPFYLSTLPFPDSYTK